MLPKTPDGANAPIEILFMKSTTCPEVLYARKRARFSEQAYSRRTLQKKWTSIHQKAEEQHIKQTRLTSGLLFWVNFLISLTHHGTSPNSGMYCLGKFSRGTPKTFEPPTRSLSFFLSKFLTVIPWRICRWNRITLLSVTFMVPKTSLRSKKNWALEQP